jgi:hypothetical protein
MIQLNASDDLYGKSTLTFNTSSNTFTTTKLGAYEQAGAVDFSDEAMTNVNIDSGAIDGTTVGASSQSSGKFTTMSGSGTLIADGNATLNGTLTVKSTVTGGSLTDGTATVSAGAASGLTTVDASGVITGGSLTDGTATITAGAASGLTTVSMNNQLTNTLGAGTAPMVITSTTKVANLNVDKLDGNDWAAPAAIGSSTPAGGTFTTLAATGDVDLGDAVTDSITATGRFDSDLIPLTDGARDLGTSALQWAEAHIDTGNIDAVESTTVVGSTSISGAMVYGDGSALTNVVATEIEAYGSDHWVQFNADDDLYATTDFTYNTGSTTLSAPTASLKNVQMSDNNAVAFEIAESTTSYMKFVTTNAGEEIVFGKDVDINGGDIDGTTVGGTTAAPGTFTPLVLDTDGTFLATLGTPMFTFDGASAGQFVVVGGPSSEMNGVEIGQTTPTLGNFTALVADAGATLTAGTATNVSLKAGISTAADTSINIVLDGGIEVAQTINIAASDDGSGIGAGTGPGTINITPGTASGASLNITSAGNTDGTGTATISALQIDGADIGGSTAGTSPKVDSSGCYASWDHHIEGGI